MKKIAVLFLSLIMAFSAVAMTACGDPLEKKAEEMNKVYDELGTAFYNAVKCCSFNEVYTSPEYSSKFSNWQTILKEAKAEKKNYIDYDEATIDGYIAKWNTAIEELNALAAKYPLPADVVTETEAITEA